KNYRKYKKIKDQISRIEMMERILIGNILAFAKGVDWHIEEKINLRIGKIRKTKNISYKNTRLLAFDIDFKTNVHLPPYVGLGKGVSQGFGMISSQKQKLYE